MTTARGRRVMAHFPKMITGLAGRLQTHVRVNAVLHGIFFSVVGSGGNRALQIGALLIIAAAPHERGLAQVSSLLLWGGILGLAISPGFSLPLVSAIAGARARGEKGAPMVLSMVLMGAALAAGVAVAVAVSAPVAPTGISKLRFCVTLAVLSGGICAQAVALSGLVAEGAYARSAISGLALGGLQVAAALLTRSPQETVILVAGAALAAASLSGLMLLRTTQRHDRAASARFSAWRNTVGRIPSALIGSSVVEPTNLVVLSYIFSRSSPSVNATIITIAQQWMGLIMFVPAALNQVTMPRLARWYERREIKSFRRGARLVFAANAVLVTTPALILFLCGPILLGLYHQGNAVYPFFILVAAGWISAMVFPFGTMLMGMGKFRATAAGNVLWAVVFILASLALSSRSTAGFAEARLVSYALFGVSIGLWTLWQIKSLPSGYGGYPPELPSSKP